MNSANRNDFNWQTPFQNVLSGTAMDRRRAWYVFRAFNIYRLIVALILLGIYFLDQRSRVFGKDDPTLFLWTTLLYMAVVILAIVGSFQRRPSLSWQTHIQTLVDVIALSLLIHASGGITSSLSILLVTAIAASGILLPLYSALTAAALAFFILLGYWFLDSPDFALSGWNDSVSFSSWIAGFLQNRTDSLGRVGILGASFFIAALLTYTLAERARRSDALVHERSRELLEMAELNQVIIRHLQSGIIVVDNFARVRLINDKARELLNYHLPIQGSALRDVSPQLSQDLTIWLVAETAPKPFRQAQHLPDITPTFSMLGSNRTDTLIFLEDSTQVTQRLQQIKLAALGRMTAGIAHEIRNPLTAISHAAQLLQESVILADSDQRLGEIIHINVKRANRIISDVLDLSRRDQIKQEDVLLTPWLEEFRREFVRGRGESQPELEIQVKPTDLKIRFDTGHLQQVLWNLCTNACLHGTPSGERVRIVLHAGRSDDNRSKAFLEVIDSGTGIEPAEVKKLFEPFFTTKAQGTGLGLYISREICEANGAQLQYIPPADERGSCFRITFAFTPLRAGA